MSTSSNGEHSVAWCAVILYSYAIICINGSQSRPSSAQKARRADTKVRLKRSTFSLVLGLLAEVKAWRLPYMPPISLKNLAVNRVPQSESK